MLKSIEDRIENLIQTIKNDSRSEISQILLEARAKEREILDAGNAQADTLRASIMEEANKKISRLKEESQANMQLQAQMLWLERREKLFDQVFSHAKARFTDISQWDAYPQALQNMIGEAVNNLQSKEIILHLDQKSAKVLNLSDITKISEENDITITLGEELTDKIGVVVESKDGHRTFDNTLETRLERMKPALKSEMLNILMGDNTNA